MTDDTQIFRKIQILRKLKSHKPLTNVEWKIINNLIPKDYIRPKSQRISKSKIYLKPQEKPPEGIRMQRGPKGGLYYETEMKVAPKKVPKKLISREDLTTLSSDKKINIIPKLDQNSLHLLILDDNWYVRMKVAEKIDQSGLNKLINDSNAVVRGEIAERIDQKNLYKFINDENSGIRKVVAQRGTLLHLNKLLFDESEDVRKIVVNKIDQTGLHRMISDKSYKIRVKVAEKIDQVGLHKMVHDSTSDVREVVVQRVDADGLSEMIDDDHGTISKKAKNRLNRMKNLPKIPSENLSTFGYKQIETELESEKVYDKFKGEVFESPSKFIGAYVKYQNNQPIVAFTTRLYGSTLRLSCLEVHPKFKRKGLGTKAMSDVVRQALTQGSKKISLIAKDNEDAPKFYAAIGMTEGIDNHYFAYRDWMQKFMDKVSKKSLDKKFLININLVEALKHDPTVIPSRKIEKTLLKSKIYLKPQEKPPEGVRMQRGPRGGLYYEIKIPITPKYEYDPRDLGKIRENNYYIDTFLAAYQHDKVRGQEMWVLDVLFNLPQEDFSVGALRQLFEDTDWEYDFKYYDKLLESWIKAPTSENNAALYEFLKANKLVRYASLYDLFLIKGDKIGAKKFGEFITSGKKITIYRGGDIRSDQSLNSFSLSEHVAAQFGEWVGARTNTYMPSVKDIFAYSATGEAEVFIKTEKLEDVESKIALLKSKVYLKPQEKPPEGIRVQRGPKGGLYYESKVKIAPKLSFGEKMDLIPETSQVNLHLLQNDSARLIRAEVAKNIDNVGLHKMIHDNSRTVRLEVAKNIDEAGLHKMITDEDSEVRMKIARRINQSGLHQLVHDVSTLVREEVIKRINQSGLHKILDDDDPNIRLKIVERIDAAGLEEMASGFGPTSEIAEKRLINIAKLDEMIKYYDKTEEIELTSDIKKQILKIVEDKSSSLEMIELIDEFYKHTPFGAFHQNSKEEWEVSSSADLSGLLKDSVLRQFGGKIRHHNKIVNWKKFTKNLYSQYPKEMIDKYVQLHKKLTRKILDIMFPDQDEIMLFRGTTKNEAISEIKHNKRVLLQTNSLSSWTQRHDIALKFAGKENGITIRTLVHKDDIWSTFMSHAYQGMEREFLIISPQNRQGTVMIC